MAPEVIRLKDCEAHLQGSVDFKDHEYTSCIFSRVDKLDYYVLTTHMEITSKEVTYNFILDIFPNSTRLE